MGIQNRSMVVWTALPRGRSGNTLGVTVYATLRLGRPDGASASLSSYVQTSLPSVLDWPGLIAGISAKGAFAATVTMMRKNKPKQIPAVSVTLTSAPDTVTYKSLFGPTTRVDCFTYRDAAQFKTTRVPYAPGPIIQGVGDTHRQWMVSSLSRGAVVQPVGTLRLSPARHAALRAATALAASLSPEFEEPPADADGPLRDLWSKTHADPFAREVFRAVRFFRHRDLVRRSRPGVARVVASASSGAPSPDAPPAPQPPPPPDFHAILGSLGDYPVVLRRLGIVFDLVVDLGMAIAADQFVSVTVTPDVSATDIATWDQRWIGVNGTTSGASLAFPSDVGVLAGATLDLGRLHSDGSPVYVVDSLDTDGAAIKAAQAANSTDGELAAQRTAGLTVFHDGRYDDYATAMTNADVMDAQILSPPRDANGNITSFATGLGSVLRGYRVDVKLDGTWYSLCQRDVVMRLGAQSLLFSDEGYVKATALTGTTTEPAYYFLRPSALGWDGWSLVAPRPRLDGQPWPNNAAPVSFGISMSVQTSPAPGTVPLLRFGKTYVFRARSVDLAGNSVGLGDLNDDPKSSAYGHPTKPVVFMRYEPVAAPAILLRAPLTEGESLERLVIRSNPATSQSAKDFAMVLNGLPDKVATFGATSDRHVAPPHASLPLSELHGAIDPIVASTGAAGFANLVRKSGGSFQDDQAFLALSGKTEPTNVATYTPPFATSATASYSYNPTSDPTATLPVPYLPDPNAAQFALIDSMPAPPVRPPPPPPSPGGGSEPPPGRPPPPPPPRIHALTYFARPLLEGATWPDARSFLLELVEAPAESLPTTSAGGGTAPAVVALPPGMMITARYSSALAPPDPKGGPTGASVMAFFGAAGAANAKAVSLATAGLIETLTPGRMVTFVHAVPRPAVGPQVSIAASRELGDTGTDFSGTLHVTAYDTLSVTVDSSWQESTAPATGTAPAQIDHAGHVGQLSVRYFDRTMDLAFPGDLPALRQEFGDTKCRILTMRFVGHGRYNEYFPPSYTASLQNVTTEGPPQAAVIVPSSARPAELRVLEVVPTFRWDEFHPGLPGTWSLGRTRAGGGIRVYVDGDWFSSGEGERLAVVLRGDPSLSFASYGGCVSGWSADPIWLQGNSGELPALDYTAFRLNASVETGLVVTDLPADASAQVTLVTYEPQFNPERGLWFFDIEIDPKSLEGTFVRLALARYQKNSVSSSIALSKIAVADVTQLLPDRTCTVAQSAPTTYDVDVYGFFHPNVSPIASRDAANWASGHVVEVEVQATTSPSAGDFGWTTLVGPVRLSRYAYDAATSQSHFRDTIAVPAQSVPAGAGLRLLVREKERFSTDVYEQPLGPEVIHDPGGPVAQPEYYQERVVYADSIRLT
jgi:hypothetical protein